MRPFPFTFGRHACALLLLASVFNPGGMGERPRPPSASSACLFSLAGCLAFGAVAWRERVQRRRAEERLSFCGALRSEKERVERQLQDSQQRFRAYVGLSPDGIFVVDSEGRYLETNPAAERLSGYTASELRQRTIFDLLHPEDRELGRHGFLEVLRHGEAEAELRHVRRTGEARYWSVKAVRLSESRVVGFVSDVHQRRLDQEELRRSQQRFQNLFEQMLEGFAVHEVICDEEGKPVDYRFLSFNATFCRMTGLSPGTVLGRTVKEVLPGIEPLWIEAFGKVALEGGTVSFESYSRELGKHFEVTAFQTAPGQFATMFQDVTARHESMAGLARLGAAIEQAGEVVMICDKQARIEYVNPAFTAITGYSRAEVEGQNPRILQSGEQNEAFYNQLWGTIREGKVWRGRLVNRRKDGSRLIEEATISPVRDAQGEITDYVAVKRDITEWVQMAERLNQAQKMEAVGRLAGGVAHDFNNLVMGLMGYTELALEKLEPDHSAREELLEVLSCSRHAAELTRQLLAFARKQAIVPRALDLNESIASTLKMLRRLIGEDLELRWQPGEDLWLVKMDPVQINQVISNLCLNARDSIEGVGTIIVTTRNESRQEAQAQPDDPPPGDYVVCSVQDTGKGMSAEVLQDIFVPFFTTKRMGEGTGLGLATVYGIVKQNEGTITVASEPGRGSTFTVYLPRWTGGLTEHEEAESPKGSSAQTEATIALVEDDRGIRALTGRMLGAMGYRVLAFDGPEAALEGLTRERPPLDLLITDVIMPGMSGRQLSEQLEATYPGLPVLYISGYTADVIAHRGVIDEQVSFLQKPFTREALAQTLAQVLSLPEGEEEAREP